MEGIAETVTDGETDLTAAEDHPGSALEPQATSSILFQHFAGGETNAEVQNDISLVLDIPLQLSVELGRARITIKRLLQLTLGSVVELDGTAGGPLKVLVNGCFIAQGEVVVVDGKFGIRVTEIIAPSERIAKLNK
jgi:flagellar motor switch protein FliN/FliY